MAVLNRVRARGMAGTKAEPEYGTERAARAAAPLQAMALRTGLRGGRAQCRFPARDLRAAGPVPPVVLAWAAGMAAMLAALWAGHLDWGLGLKQTIKSTVGWAKGWALLALFPFAGAVLPIRREILVRGQCIVGLWTLALTPILFMAPQIGLPERLFTSPLKAVGGPGPEYFTVFFFTWDPGSWTPRWQFYAPWSPFAALLGVIQVCFALEERRIKWRAIGVAAGVTMILLSKSRMGLVGLVACTVGPRMMPLILCGWAWHAVAGLAGELRTSRGFSGAASGTGAGERHPASPSSIAAAAMPQVLRPHATMACQLPAGPRDLAEARVSRSSASIWSRSCSAAARFALPSSAMRRESSIVAISSALAVLIASMS